MHIPRSSGHPLTAQQDCPPPPPVDAVKKNDEVNDKHNGDKSVHTLLSEKRYSMHDTMISWYIQDAERLLFDNKHIPLEIKEICLLFYHIPPEEKAVSETEFWKKYFIESKLPSSPGKRTSGGFLKLTEVIRKSDNKMFYFKMLKKKYKIKEEIDRFKIEIMVLYECNHENIPKLNDYCNGRNRFYFTADICKGRKLVDYVYWSQNINEKSVINIVKQITSALDHLHGFGYIHSDLKPDNLIYDVSDGESKVKLVGFESCTICNYGSSISKQTRSLSNSSRTLVYTAPEILTGQEYNKSVDMWSLGVIIYLLLSGNGPFYNEQNKNVLESIKSAKYSFWSPVWDDINENAKDLIKKLLMKDPDKRLTSWRVLNHAWIINEDDASNDAFGKDYMNRMHQWIWQYE